MLLRARARERVLSREQAVAEHSDLLGTHFDRLRHHGDPSPRRPCPRAHGLRFVPGPSDRLRDSGVLGPDPVGEVELLEHVAVARRREDDVERLDAVALVDRHHPQLEPGDRDLVLASQEMEPVGLEAEELVQLVELPLMECQVLLERRESRGDVSDLPVEAPDVVRDRVDLRAEDLLARTGFCDPLMEVREPLVDLLLPIGGTGSDGGYGSGICGGAGGSVSPGGGYGSGICGGAGGSSSPGGGYGSGMSGWVGGSIAMLNYLLARIRSVETSARGSSARSASAAWRRRGPTIAR